MIRCVHVIEELEACDIDEDGNLEVYPVWACETCGEEFLVDRLIRFVRAGSRTIH